MPLDARMEKKIVEWYTEDGLTIEQVYKRLRAKGEEIGRHSLAAISAILKKHNVQINRKHRY